MSFPVVMLTLGVLRRFTGPLESGLLPLFGTCVTRQQPLLAQYRLEAFVGPYEGAGNTVLILLTSPLNPKL